MADKLDKLSAEGLDQMVEKAFVDAEKDVYEYEGKTYTAHAAAAVFPFLPDDDFNALVASLKLNGMRTPVVLVGTRIVDGRNRFRAAKKAGAKIHFRQLDPAEDVCKFVMDMNIHRRNLSVQRKVALASTLRRMAIRIEQMRRDAMREQVRQSREQEAAGGDGSDAPAEATLSQPAPAEPSPGAADGASGGSASGAAPAADVDAAAAQAADEKDPHPLDTSSPLVSREKAAELAGVSPATLKRFDKVVETAPELQEPMAEGKMSVADAAVVSQEDPELRRQVVEDVREGRARTGAQAIEKRTGRAPKAHSRQKASGGAKDQQSAGASGAVEGMPPLPTVGGGADGKAVATAAAAGAGRRQGCCSCRRDRSGRVGRGRLVASGPLGHGVVPGVVARGRAQGHAGDLLRPVFVGCRAGARSGPAVSRPGAGRVPEGVGRPVLCLPAAEVGRAFRLEADGRDVRRARAARRVPCAVGSGR